MLMTFEPVLPWLLCVLLLTVRLTAAVALSPAFTAFGTPLAVRLALAFAVAALVFADGRPVPQAQAWVAEPVRLVGPVLVEIGLGALMGLSVQVVLAAFAVAGRLMDVQAGFAIGSIFDPVTRGSSNVLGSLLSLLGVVLFVAGGAHLELIRLVARSVDVFPIGSLPALNDPLRPLQAAGWMFALGLALAAPLALALLVADLAVGAISRNMTQMNVLMLAIPFKILLAYATLAVVVPAWGPLVRGAFARAADSTGLR
jgi:flagellar biosynthetic protein FliR